MRILFTLALLLSACGGSTANRESASAAANNDEDDEVVENTDEDAGTATAHAVDMCRDNGPGNIRELEDYSAIPGDEENTFTAYVTMHYAGEAWAPRRAIRMPHNHATRIEITNLDEFPGLEHNQAELMRFTLEFGSREVTQDERDGEEVWFAVYQARLTAACFLPPENGLDARAPTAE